MCISPYRCLTFLKYVYYTTWYQVKSSGKCVIQFHFDMVQFLATHNCIKCHYMTWRSSMPCSIHQLWFALVDHLLPNSPTFGTTSLASSHPKTHLQKANKIKKGSSILCLTFSLLPAQKYAIQSWAILTWGTP
jgi:hypothetical protein